MKKLILTITLITIINAQEFGEWRWSHQKFMDAPKHNIQHLGTGLISFTLDHATNLKWWQSDLIAMSAGIVWECKDALVPWEKIGYWGGEGFSLVDVRTDFYGVAINRILNYSIHKIMKKQNKFVNLNIVFCIENPFKS